MVTQLDILAQVSLPVVVAGQAALHAVNAWLAEVNHPKRLAKGKGREILQVQSTLQGALDDFQTRRLAIIKPFRHLFDPTHPADTAHFQASQVCGRTDD